MPATRGTPRPHRRRLPGPHWPTPIPRVALMRAEAPTEPGSAIYDPVVCFAAQGRKQLMVADRAFAYDAAHYLVVSVDLPVIAAITGSPRRPTWRCAWRSTRRCSRRCCWRCRAPTGRGRAGIGIGPLEADLLDPVLRLMRLLDRPDEPRRWRR